MVIAQLGRRDAPYIYFDVIDEERYSATLDRHFRTRRSTSATRTTGRPRSAGSSSRPSTARRPSASGLSSRTCAFSTSRCTASSSATRSSPSSSRRSSPTARRTSGTRVGRKFTGLTYAEADRLSKKNKEFIRGLFPEGTIYATLLPQKAQDVIGKVGVQTRGVEKMLRRIGFRYAERVDPFDGGPHFTAPTDEVTLVQRAHAATRRRSCSRPSDVPKTRALVAVEPTEAPYFRCVHTAWRASGEAGAEIAARGSRASRDCRGREGLGPAARVEAQPAPSFAEHRRAQQIRRQEPLAEDRVVERLRIEPRAELLLDLVAQRAAAG